METYMLINTIYDIFDVVGKVAGIVVLGYTVVELLLDPPQYIFKRANKDGNEK